MNIGILSLQGSIMEHEAKIKALKHNPIQVKLPEHLEKIDSLIIPGGESTTMLKLMREYNLDKAIIEKSNNGLPIYGVCAGSVVLAHNIKDNPASGLKLLDVEIKRNNYGRQIDSFETPIQIKNFSKPFHAIFIRAPTIQSYNLNTNVFAEFNSKPVMLQQNNILITTFHPELTDDLRIHKYFIENI